MRSNKLLAPIMFVVLGLFIGSISGYFYSQAQVATAINILTDYELDEYQDYSISALYELDSLSAINSQKYFIKIPNLY